MKKRIMILIAAVFSITANAQHAPAAAESDVKTERKGKDHHPDANQRATRLTEYMTQKLTLTEAQKKDVFSINLNKAQKTDALYAEKGADKKGLGIKRKAIEQERDAELRRVFSVEQYDKWMKLKAEKKKDKKEKHEKGKDKSGKVKGENEDDNDGAMIDQMERD